MSKVWFLLSIAASGCTRPADSEGRECIDHDPARNWPSFCDEPCVEYCDALLGEVCPPGLVDGPEGDDLTQEECMAHCQAQPVDGELGDEFGDTLQCRFFYLTIVRDHFQRGYCGDAYGADQVGRCEPGE